MQLANSGVDEELEEILLDECKLLLDENTELEDFRLLEEITELEELTLLEEITELDDFTLLDELILFELLLLEVLELVLPMHLVPFSKNSVGLIKLVPFGRDTLKPKLIVWLVLMLPFHAAFLTRTDCPVWE